MLRKIASSQAALAIAGFLLASYGRLIGRTNRILRIPNATFFEPLDREPVIVALWHGEHFLMPFFGWQKGKLNVLVTLHRDGEIVARAGKRFGLKFIRGSGDHGPEFMRKRPVQAFMSMLRLLKRGESIVMTADVPKISRVAGLGIVTLSRHSGCPIVPVAMATSRRFRFGNWDRTSVSLPFGRMVMVRGEPIRVARDADEAAMEAARHSVEQGLNEVTTHAYALADGKEAPVPSPAIPQSVP
jgi:lysophospholipid acyltransferase (LPLAT)-like uncharacterized protein